MKIPKKLRLITLIYFVCFAAYAAFDWQHKKTAYAEEEPAQTVSTSTRPLEEVISTAETVVKETEKKATKTEKTPVDWRGPSEDKPYPTLQEGDWIEVSIEKQRTYIKRGDETLYTMLCSTGAAGEKATPTGTFSIEGERGDTFFNASSGEGANYWVSWKDHGVYLFHTVPIDQQGNYIPAEAEHLGEKAVSHGCIRLSVSDAKWFYENALWGMKVVVK